MTVPVHHVIVKAGGREDVWGAQSPNSKREVKTCTTLCRVSNFACETATTYFL